MQASSLVLLLVLADAQSSPIVPAGTRIEAKLESSVQTSRSVVGDDVMAIVTAPIRVAATTIVPRGSRLNGRVETVQAATHDSEGRVRLVFREIELPDGRHVSTWITNSFDAHGPRRARRFVLLMASGGVAGGFIGGKAARVAGILGGMVVGFVIAENGGDSNLPNLTLRSGQTIQLQLGEDLAIPSQ